MQDVNNELDQKKKYIEKLLEATQFKVNKEVIAFYLN